nr:putative ribonuclease H-like domain-containing protein [Tanacetum cinerariifolium]
MAFEQSSSGPALHKMTPTTISLGLVPKPTSLTLVDPPAPKVIAPIAEVVAPDGEDVDVHSYRLISWQCKKQTVVATSSTEAEYVAAASGCEQVLWMQNQLLDYGYNFMHTVKQKKDGIFISQDKYVAEILRKFGLSEGKSASTPIDAEKPLLKDSDGKDVDVHTYRLISWQCKKQTVVATSSIKAEYVAAASVCAQVLWMINQLLDYGG